MSNNNNIDIKKNDTSVINIKEEEEIQKQIDAKLNEEIQENSEPIWITKLFVDKTFYVVGIWSFIFILSAVITFASSMLDMSPSHNRDYLLWEQERTIHYDMFMEAQSEFLKGQISSQIPINTIIVDDWTTFIILKANDDKDNILDVENFKFLYETEQKIKNLKNYENFCQKSEQDSTDGCFAGSHFSITSLFTNPSSVTQQEINDVLNDIVSDETKWLTFKGMFGSEFSASNQNSHLLRSMFFFGGPISINGKTYKDIFDNETEQNDHFDDFTEKILDYIEDEDLVVPGGVKILGYSESMSDLQTQNTANSDFLWAFGSIIFVLIYMGIHLKSIFLSSMSMLSIIFSFPITLVIFNGILRITYFSSLHILVIFIVLGISADNVFVFIDGWNQTESYELLKGDYHKRMAFTFRRASKAILATSSTTAAAFFSTGLSPIMPISSFGLFAGILIPVNFVLVITFFPAILMIYEKYTKNLCSGKSNTEKQENQEQQNRRGSIYDNPLQISKLQQKQVKAKEHSIIKFFDNEFNDNVFRFRYAILGIFTVWSIFSIYRTLQLPALSEPEQFLPDDHPSTQASDAMRYDFHMAGNSDTGIKVNQYWGVKGIDKSDVGTWDPSDLGKIVWDNNFDLSPEANQQYLYDLCVKMKDSNLVQDGLVTCFMVDFKQYVEDLGETFPVDQGAFLQKLTDFTTSSLGISHYNDNSIGLIKGELKYVQIELSALGIPFSPYIELNPVYEQWNDYVKQTNKEAPQGFNNCQQTAQMGWVFMITEKEFTTSALEGTAISIAFAFLVLLLTSHNIIISFYSILTIVGIVFSVISIMEMAGWELGVAESIAIVILIGMSVDYVVHLANHYVESVYPDRFRKMKVSLKDLGISIVSGATTTIGSGIFLFFCTMIIFNKFAILIVATICFSLAYALVFFSALIHVVGPQGEQGNYLILMKKCMNKKSKVQNSQTNSVDNDVKNNSNQKNEKDLQI